MTDLPLFFFLVTRCFVFCSRLAVIRRRLCVMSQWPSWNVTRVSIKEETSLFICTVLCVSVCLSISDSIFSLIPLLFWSYMQYSVLFVLFLYLCSLFLSLLSAPFSNNFNLAVTPLNPLIEVTRVQVNVGGVLYGKESKEEEEECSLNTLLLLNRDDTERTSSVGARQYSSERAGHLLSHYNHTRRSSYDW